MKLFSALLFLTVCCLSAAASGDTIQEIELTDGSIVHAAILSMDRGMYRLRSETLGELTIPAHRIRAIRSPSLQDALPPVNSEPLPTQPPPASASPAPFEVPAADDLQHRLMQDPVTMSKILSLQDDPLIQDILSDERTLQAIEAGDLDVLLNDPKIKALMEHPTVQELGHSYGR